MLYDGDIIEHDGARFRVEFPFDDSGDTPWERDDGHGEVSDWKRHAFGQGSKPPKRAGELILCWDPLGPCLSILPGSPSMMYVKRG